MQDMVSSFQENIQAFLAQCRDLETFHHEKMMEIAIVTLEKVLKNELDDEINEDLRMVSQTLIKAVVFKNYFDERWRVIKLYQLEVIFAVLWFEIQFSEVFNLLYALSSNTIRKLAVFMLDKLNVAVSYSFMVIEQT